jgi:ribosome-binding factor A
MQRVSDLLQEVATECIRTIKDPAVEGALITITSVQVAADLSTARFYVTIMNKPVGEVVEALNRAAGYLRREMTKQVHLKRVPSLQFVFDDTFEQAMRMQQLLHQVSQELPSEQS